MVTLSVFKLTFSLNLYFWSTSCKLKKYIFYNHILTTLWNAKESTPPYHKAELTTQAVTQPKTFRLETLNAHSALHFNIILLKEIFFQYSIVCNHIRAFYVFYNILHLFLLMSAVSVMVLTVLLTVSYCIPKDGC